MIDLDTTPCRADASASDLPEAELLASESARVRAAISRLSHELPSNLAHAVDPRLWTKQHPWLGVAVAAMAGIGAARAMRPAKTSPVSTQPYPVSSELESHTPARQKFLSTVFSAVMLAFFGLVKQALQASVLAGVRKASRARQADATADASAANASEGTSFPVS